MTRTITVAEQSSVRNVTHKAMGAFWEEVAINYPEFKTGDLDPVITQAFEVMATYAVHEWVEYNRPKPKP